MIISSSGKLKVLLNPSFVKVFSDAVWDSDTKLSILAGLMISYCIRKK